MLAIDTRAARVTWTAFLVLGVIALIYIIRAPILLFIFAMFIAYMVSPLVNLVDRFTPPNSSRSIALAVVYLLLALGFGVYGTWRVLGLVLQVLLLGCSLGLGATGGLVMYACMGVMCMASLVLGGWVQVVLMMVQILGVVLQGVLVFLVGVSRVWVVWTSAMGVYAGVTVGGVSKGYGSVGFTGVCALTMYVIVAWVWSAWNAGGALGRGF